MNLRWNIKSGFPAYAALTIWALIVFHSIFMLENNIKRSSAPLAAFIIENLFSLPAIGYLLGISWLRFVVGLQSALFGALLMFTPLALHAIDRTNTFWIIWVCALTLLGFATVASFLPPKSSCSSCKSC